jgi:mannose-6-phosphate isomerase-like protein (cupin superfamily)
VNERISAGNSYEVGASDTRPWGSWRVIDVGVGYAVKRITVEPGNILSLQRHQHRSEHWTVVQGLARVRVGDEELELGPNEAVYIPPQALHRIQNVGAQSMVFIEVQCGAILDENDIERIEDTYGRA